MALGGAGGGTIANSQDDKYRQVSSVSFKYKREVHCTGPELAVALGGVGGGTIASSQDDEYRQVVFHSLQNKEATPGRSWQWCWVGRKGAAPHIASSQDDEYRQVVFHILQKKVEKYTLCRTMFALPGYGCVCFMYLETLFINGVHQGVIRR
jgi:hypothetical protein